MTVNRPSGDRTLGAIAPRSRKVGMAVRRQTARPVSGDRAWRHIDPEHRSIVVVDVAGSSRWDDLTQLDARVRLDAAVRAAFRAARVPRHGLVVQDRGDGMLVLVPATVSKAVLLDPVVPHLDAALRRHNGSVGPDRRIRVRVAVHAGEVLHGPCGWIGADLNLACRLVDSPPLYRALARAPHADVAVVVSETIHRAVVRHRHRGVDPAAYRPVDVVLKEVRTRAWTHVPAAHVPGAEVA